MAPLPGRSQRCETKMKQVVSASNSLFFLSRCSMLGCPVIGCAKSSALPARGKRSCALMSGSAMKRGS